MIRQAVREHSPMLEKDYLDCVALFIYKGQSDGLLVTEPPPLTSNAMRCAMAKKSIPRNRGNFKPIPLPPQSLLLERYIYDPETGELSWNVRPKYRRASPGGIQKNGYTVVSIGETRYLAHRIIWKMVYGEEPLIIDHINGNRSDNRLDNLRSIHSSRNAINRGKIINKTLPKGVFITPAGRYLARISVNKKVYHLGHWGTIAEAKAAYHAGSIILHGKFARREK